MKQLFLLTCLIMQLTIHAQYQVQKGRWIISHTIGGFSSSKQDYKQYFEEELMGDFTIKNTGFQLAFIGPDWGSAYISSSKYSDNRYGSETKESGAGFYLQPQAGYFIRDNLMIGAGILIGIETSKYEDGDEVGKERYLALGLGPILRYYIGKNQKRKPFVGFESRFDFIREKDIEDDTDGQMMEYFDYRTNGSRVMIKPYAGYAWFLGKRFTAEARIEYFVGKETTKRTTNFYVDGSLDSDYPQSGKFEIARSSIGLNIGISYTF